MINSCWGLAPNADFEVVDVDVINQNIANVLVPLQNDTTNATLKFKDIDIDEQRANSLSLNAHYFKKSDTNQFVFVG